MSSCSSQILFAMDTMQIVMFVVLGLVLVAMFIYPMFSNKKKQQQLASLFDGLRPGDKIKTVGGIIGVITEVNAGVGGKEITISTGTSTMVFDIQFVYQVIDKADRPATEVQEKIEEKTEN